MSPVVVAPPPFSPSISARSTFYSYLQGGSSATLAQGVGGLNLSPFHVYSPFTISRLGAEVTVVAGAGDAGATMILAIYADNGAFCPGALLFDSSVSGSASTILGNGLIDLRSATVQELTCSIPLSPGIYWVGSVCQNVTHDGTAFGTAPTLRSISADAHFSGPVSTTLPGAGGTWNGYGYRQLSVFAALPNPLVPGTMPNSVAPRIIFKAA